MFNRSMGWLTSAVSIWTAAFVLVKALDRACQGAVSEALTNHNVVLHLGCVYFSTNRFNPTIDYFARRYRWFWRRWFGIGVVLGFFGLLFSVAALSISLLSAAGTGAVFDSHTVEVVAPPVHQRPARSEPSGMLTTASRPWIFLKLLFSASGHEGIRKAFAVANPEMQLPAGSHHMHGEKPKPLPGLNPADPSLRRTHRGTNTENRGHGFRRRLLAAVDDSAAHDVVTAGPDFLGSSRLGVGRVESPSNAGKGNIGLDHDGVTARPGEVGAENADLISEMPGGETSSVEGPIQRTRLTPQVSGEDGGLADIEHRLSKRRHKSKLLTPLLPGVTIPATDAGYIVVAILLSAVVHELGHALAACVLEAKVDSVGAMVLLVFPGAYVSLAGVSSLSPYRQLKVWCAGALHNVALALACLVAISLLPFLLVALYERGGGALVVSLPDDSPLAPHVLPGDVIKNFGRFQVVDGGSSFRSALVDLVETGDSAGFCISEAIFQKYAHRASTCCDLLATGQRHASLQCFSISDGVHVGEKRSCMSPSVVASRATCRSSSDCRTSAQVGPEGIEPEKCFVAILPGAEKLVDIRVESANSGKLNQVFFKGHARALGQAVSVSSYVPKHRWLLPEVCLRSLAEWDVPNMLERQLQYVVSISLALAILNMAPVYYLDGEAAVSLFLKAMVPTMGPLQLARWSGRLLATGTSLLVLNILVALID